MPLDEDFPRTNRNWTAQLQTLLSCDPGLDSKDREEIALALNDLADKACDLDEMVRRLFQEPHTPAEIGELLMAFELTTEQLRGQSEAINGKLYAIGDRLKELPAAKPS
jgi:hypothetical protein